MNNIATSQVPLPIVLAFAGFLLSVLFPTKLHPLSSTAAGFLLGLVIVRIIEQLRQELADSHDQERPRSKTLLLREPADHRL